LLRIKIKIPGKPQGKQRARFRVLAPAAGKTKHRVMTYTPKETDSWEDSAAIIIKNRLRAFTSEILNPPLTISVVAVCKRPQRLCKKSEPDGIIWRPNKPDGDNILKAVGDAITKSGMVLDDRHIVDWLIQSAYGPKGSSEEYVLLILEETLNKIGPDMSPFNELPD